MIAVLWLSLLTIQTGAPPERVSITRPNGTILAGQYFDAGTGNPAVLFFSMCRADATEGWTPVAEHLRSAGISSLSVSPRGFGGGTAQGSGDQRAADADAALAFLQTRTGGSAPLAVAGSSCGVYLSLSTAMRHAAQVRAAVALTGPHVGSQVDFVRQTAQLAVFSGAAEGDVPAPDWARELKAASANPASRIALAAGRAHGTDIFQDNPAFAREIAEWLTAQLRARPSATPVP